MTIQKKGKYTISLSQKDSRFYAEGNKIKYSQCRLVIAKQNKYIANVSGIWKRDTYVELEKLEAGDYQIYVFMDWDKNTPEEDRFYNITSYGPKSAKFEVADADDCTQEKGLEYLTQVFLGKAK